MQNRPGTFHTNRWTGTRLLCTSSFFPWVGIAGMIMTVLWPVLSTDKGKWIIDIFSIQRWIWWMLPIMMTTITHSFLLVFFRWLVLFNQVIGYWGTDKSLHGQFSMWYNYAHLPPMVWRNCRSSQRWLHASKMLMWIWACCQVSRSVSVNHYFGDRRGPCNTLSKSTSSSHQYALLKIASY